MSILWKPGKPKNCGICLLEKLYIPRGYLKKNWKGCRVEYTVLYFTPFIIINCPCFSTQRACFFFTSETSINRIEIKLQFRWDHLWRHLEREGGWGGDSGLSTWKFYKCGMIILVSRRIHTYIHTYNLYLCVKSKVVECFENRSYGLFWWDI